MAQATASHSRSTTGNTAAIRSQAGQASTLGACCLRWIRACFTEWGLYKKTVRRQFAKRNLFIAIELRYSLSQLDCISLYLQLSCDNKFDISHSPKATR